MIFMIEKMDPPETVAIEGGNMVLTHRTTALTINPADPVDTVVVHKFKGYLNAAGNFRDYGAAERASMDKKGFEDLLTMTGGDFKISEILPAIEARRADLELIETARANEAKDRETQALEDFKAKNGPATTITAKAE